MLEQWLAEIAPDIQVHHGYIVRTPDGTLYLGRGEHEVFAHKLGKLTVNPQSFVDFDTNIIGRIAYTSRRNIKYVHAIAPDKESVVTEPLRALNLTSFIDLYQKNCKAPFLDLRPQAPIAGAYYRTDTHWALPLQMDAALRIVRAFGVNEGEIAERHALLTENTTPQTRGFCGDLGIRFEPQETELHSDLRTRWMKSHSITPLGGWNDGLIHIFRNAAGPKRRLLVFGDSFGHSLCNFLSVFFSDILFCRSGYFHKEMVDMMRPTHVLTQQVERFLNASLRDAEARRFLLIPFINDSKIGASPEFWSVLNDILTPPIVLPWYQRSRLVNSLMKYLPLSH